MNKYVLAPLKIKTGQNKKRIYLFFIPLLLIKNDDDTQTNIYLFDRIPLLKINYGKRKTLFLFGKIPFFSSNLEKKTVKVLFKLQGGLGDIILALNFLFNLKEKFQDSLEISVATKKCFHNVKTFLHQQDFIKNTYKVTPPPYFLG